MGLIDLCFVFFFSSIQIFLMLEINQFISNEHKDFQLFTYGILFSSGTRPIR